MHTLEKKRKKECIKTKDWITKLLRSFQVNLTMNSYITRLFSANTSQAEVKITCGSKASTVEKTTLTECLPEPGTIVKLI